MKMKKLWYDILTDKRNNSFKSFMVLMFYRFLHEAYNTRHLGIRLGFLSFLKGLTFWLLGIDA